jgi:hypothetical protein
MNPLFQKKTNDEQDPIILPQDDNRQGDMLDPATHQVAPPPPVAPAEDEKIAEPSRMAAQKSAAATTPWDVYLRGKWVNRVYSVPNMTADDVKRGLVDHDGLNPAIEVRSGEGRNVPGSVPLNRIGSKNPLLQKDGAGAPIGMDQGQQTCYKCKQPIQQGEMLTWEGGMESHMTCPSAQGSAQEQSRIMFPKGQQPKKPQMGPTSPQTPQRAPNKPQYASEKVATRRKISGFVPATSWGVPQEYAHQVAHTLANAGMRDFDVATDEELHVAYFSFGNEAEMEVSADIVCEFYGSQIAASKGKWIGWQCRPERQPGVPAPQAMPLTKMNSKRAGSQGTREAVAKLKNLGIKTTADLDKWIKEHPKTETKGPYAGSRSLMSRYDALNVLVGEDAATWILHDLATDAAAKELPKRGAVEPSNFEGDTIEEQVANLMEKRSFSEDGKGNGWVIYSRNTEYAGDGTWLKVFFKDGKVTKTDMFDEEPENVLETRLGFDGLHSFTQAFGD